MLTRHTGLNLTGLNLTYQRDAEAVMLRYNHIMSSREAYRRRQGPTYPYAGGGMSTHSFDWQEKRDLLGVTLQLIRCLTACSG